MRVPAARLAARATTTSRRGWAWRGRPAQRAAARCCARRGGLYYDSSLSIATDLVNGGPLNLSQFGSSRHAPFSMLLSYGFMPDLRLAVVKQWSASVERALGESRWYRWAYAGSAGRQLVRREMGGPGSTRVCPGSRWPPTMARSDYHGLQLQYRRSLARGLQAFVSYTWSHSIDNSSSDSAAALGRRRAPRRRATGAPRISTCATRCTARVHVGSRRAAGRWTGCCARARAFPSRCWPPSSTWASNFANAFRPDLAPGQPIWLVDAAAPGGRRLNPEAFRVAPESVQGRLGRNAITGFGMSQVDAGAAARIPLRRAARPAGAGGGVQRCSTRRTSGIR